MPSTYEKIATTTLGSSSSTITFSSLSSAYTDLVIVSQFFTTSATGVDIYFRFNNDSSSNYSYAALEGMGTGGAGSARTTNQTATYLDPIHYLTYPNTTTPVQSIININNYSSSNYKTVLSENGLVGDQITRIVHLWRSTSAINRIDFTMVNASFAAGTTVSIYGILKA